MTLITAKAVAEKLSIHPTTVHRMVNRGDLRGVRVGGTLRIEAESLDEYIEANRITPTMPRATLRRQPPPGAKAYPWLTNAS